MEIGRDRSHPRQIGRMVLEEELQKAGEAS